MLIKKWVKENVEHAMPWDKLMLLHTQYKMLISVKLLQTVRNRIANNEHFKLIEDNAKWIDSRRTENTIA
jgi:carboxyl-terminal processing protease